MGLPVEHFPGDWSLYGFSALSIPWKSLMAVSNDDALLRNDGVYRWRVLSHGIPAESFATGANRIPKFSDVLLRFTRKAKSRNDYHMSMEVSFTNQMYAGAYVLKQDLQSEMKSVYNAETNATYVQSFSYMYDRPAQNCGAREKLKEDEYLVFRSRTVVDDCGQLVSARYGKIYGPWHYVGPRGMSIHSIYFNPTPNNTNLEDCHTAEGNEKTWRRNR